MSSPPPTLPATVRDRILAEIVRRLSAITGMADSGVIDAMVRDADDRITAAVAGKGTAGSGRYAAELIVGDDERVLAEEDNSQLVVLEMPVVVVLHLPDELPPDGSDPPTGATLTPAQAASRINAAIEALYSSSWDPVGRWLETGTNVALALQTKYIAGGGITRDPKLGTLLTPHAFTVTYRYTRGNPGEPR